MKDTKIVECRICGVEMIVSKFASNTPSCQDCREKGHKLVRKRSDKPRRNTKAWYIEEIINKFNEYREIHEQLMELYNQGKIKYGAVVAYGLYDNYSYRWFYGMLDGDNKCKGYGTGEKNTKLWDYSYHLEKIEEAMKEAREIVEKNK